MTTPPATFMAEQLIKLARRRYKEELSELEERILRCVAVGEVCDCENEVVSADFYVWLCTDRAAQRFVHHSGVRLQFAIFNSTINLQCAVIPYLLMLNNCTVNADFYIQRTETRGLYLSGSTFKHIIADGLRVDGPLNLERVTINGAVRLLGAKISGDLDCSGATMHAPKDGDCKDLCLVADGLQVVGTVILKEANIYGTVRLQGTNIGGDLVCMGSKITAPANGDDVGTCLMAQGTLVNGSIFLTDKFTPQGEISFMYANVAESIQLHGIINAQDWSFDIRHVKAGCLYDKKDSWPRSGQLQLNGFIYARFDDRAQVDVTARKEWLGLMPNDGQHRPQPYEQLAKVLRESGHETTAKKILIEKQRMYLKSLPWSSPILWDSCLPRINRECQSFKKAGLNILGFLTGHGYEPWRPALAMLFMIFLGFVIFNLGMEARMMDKFQASSIFQNNPALATTFETDPYPEFSPFWYSLDAFVPLVNLHQEEYWMPVTGESGNVKLLFHTIPISGDVLRWYLWCHILLGWIFTSLFVVGLTGLMRKDE